MTMKQLLALLVLGPCLGCGGAVESTKVSATPAKVSAAPRRTPKRALSAEQIQSKMRERVASMAACYELSPARAAAKAGELTVDFTVEANGTVSAGSVTHDTIVDKVLDQCVLGVVRATAFPKADLSTDVSWPLRFGER